MNKKALNSELSEWQQKKLEEGKFPCAKCYHFQSTHVKGMCLACHNTEGHDKHSDCCCWHRFQQMDNLTLIEWVAKQREKQNGTI